MSILKYLIASLLISSSLVSEEANSGWFPVEKVRKGVEKVEEDDPSIWVLFAKSLGAEKILIRFPEAPSYRYLEDGSLEIVSERGGETYLLTVQEVGPMGPPVSDLHYQSEGKWIHEHFIQSEHHFYHFKTISNQADGGDHKAFISSFLIERNS